MKRLVMLFSLIALLYAAGLAEIEKKYDRFTRQTVVSIKLIPLKYGNPILGLMAEYAGEKFEGNFKNLWLMFMSSSQKWQYLNCNDTHILIDGEPYNPGVAGHQGQVEGSSVYEVLSYSNVRFVDFQRMAAAKKIEVKICFTEFTLSQSEMNDLKEFVRLLTPEKSLPGPPSTVSF